MKQLFIDTGIWAGAVSPRDRLHLESKAILDRVVHHEWGQVFTSDFVLAEAFNFIAKKIKRKESADTLEGLVFGSEESRPLVTSVLRVHGGRFAAALEQYRTRFDAGLTLTDWSSVITMKELGINEMATFDRPLASFVRVLS